mgnify:CR=1 FL=1
MAEYSSSVEIEADPEDVFDFLVTNEGMTAWMGQHAALDPMIGGDFAVNIAGYAIRGEYLEIDRPRRLVFTFAVPALSPEYDRVTVQIVRLDKGCELTLTSEMSPEIYAEWGEQTREGWTAMLGGLADALRE